MTLIAIRRGLPPGFTELAADHDLAAALGTEAFGALLRLCHLASPSADVPGSWVIDHTRADLAAHLGVGYGKVAKLLAVLTETGALVADPGMRLGRGMGSTNTRYFLTAIPGLTAPAPRGPNPDGGRRTTSVPGGSPQPATDRDAGSRVTEPSSAPGLAVVVSADTTPKKRTSKNGSFENGMVYSETVHPSPMEVLGDYRPSESTTVSDLTDENSSHDLKTPDSSALLARNLTRLGWDGPPPAADPQLVALVAGHLASRTDLANKAGYLNRLIRNNDLERYAAERGLATPATATGIMTSAEYVRWRDLDPQWAEQVRAAAEDLAAARSVPVRMALLCEAATGIGAPTAREASS